MEMFSEGSLVSATLAEFREEKRALSDVIAQKPL